MKGPIGALKALTSVSDPADKGTKSMGLMIPLATPLVNPHEEKPLESRIPLRPKHLAALTTIYPRFSRIVACGSTKEAITVSTKAFQRISVSYWLV